MTTLSIAIDRAARSISELGAYCSSPLTSLTDAELMAGFHDAAELRKAVDGVMLEFSSVIASRSGGGPDSLAKKAGFASPTALIAETAGINPAEAAKVVRVADATTPRLDESGRITTRYAHAGAALAGGTVTTEHVDLIARTLDSVRSSAKPEELEAVERTLVELAPSLRAGDLRRVCEQAKVDLDPASLEPSEAAQREARALQFSKRGGMSVLTWFMPADQAALVRTGIDAVARSLGRGSDTQPEPASPVRELARYDLNGLPLNGPAKWQAQLRADAAFAIFDHTATCTNRDPKLPSFTAIIRVDLETLRSQVAEQAESRSGATGGSTRGSGGSSAASSTGGSVCGAGRATSVDGLDQPLSAALARRIAAKAGIIPAVMGEGRDIPLNLGTRTRFFTPAQRIALAERDGGCAWPGCSQTLAWSDAHHIDWWSRSGPTDLGNGIMLCPSHHHRIHDNGWAITFDRPPGAPGAPGSPGSPDGQHIPWFIPPPEWVATDPEHRTALPGGNPTERYRQALCA